MATSSLIQRRSWKTVTCWCFFSLQELDFKYLSLEQHIFYQFQTNVCQKAWIITLIKVH